jgi:hypothetical protein
VSVCDGQVLNEEEEEEEEEAGDTFPWNLLLASAG